MKILALDPATHCGWAHSDGASGEWDLSIRRDESGGMRVLRLSAKLREIIETTGVELVVFEAARHAGAKMQGALVVQAELQGVIKLVCEERGVEFRGYSPSELKKHATGKGNANKAAMQAAALAKFGKEVGDNEADALWLLDLAARDVCAGTLERVAQPA
jgi:Holliday junction resolvasome RuvABC endonuclease subunit